MSGETAWSLITIDVNDESIAELLFNYATDWTEVLVFLDRLAQHQGLFINKKRVAELMAKKFGIELEQLRSFV